MRHQKRDNVRVSSYFTEKEQSFFQEIRKIMKYADMQRQRREAVKRYVMDVR